MKTGTNMETEKHNVETSNDNYNPAKTIPDKHIVHGMNQESIMTTRTDQEISPISELYNLYVPEETLSSSEESANNPASTARESINPYALSNDDEDNMAKLVNKITNSITKQKQDLAKWKKDSCTMDHIQIPENRNENNNNMDNPINNPHNNTIQNNDSTIHTMQPNIENIIQWNINGFYARIDDIKLLIEERDPTVLCFQETRLNKKDKAKISGFRGFLNSGETRQRGTAIFVKRDTTATEINLSTGLNAVAVRVGFKKHVTICSLYIAPNESVTKEDLSDLTDQLPIPFVITGDINAHNPIWGSRYRDRMGNNFEQYVDEKGLVILNTEEMTHYSIAYGTLTAIDLTVASADLAFELGWHVASELHNSDHYSPLPYSHHNGIESIHTLLE
jgi:Endonuclease-reverse transcriptase